MTSAPPLHVVPDRFGGWHVQREGEERPLSDHGTATDAERAAADQARRTGAPGVVIHDRYGRTRQSVRALS